MTDQQRIAELERAVAERDTKIAELRKDAERWEGVHDDVCGEYRYFGECPHVKQKAALPASAPEKEGER